MDFTSRSISIHTIPTIHTYTQSITVHTSPHHIHTIHHNTHNPHHTHVPTTPIERDHMTGPSIIYTQSITMHTITIHTIHHNIHVPHHTHVPTTQIERDHITGLASMDFKHYRRFCHNAMKQRRDEIQSKVRQCCSLLLQMFTCVCGEAS